MASFTYEVRDSAGRTSNGALTAADIDEASRMLRQDGRTVLSLHEDDPDGINEYYRAQSSKKKIKRDDVIFFATQLAVMVDTGVPLSEALWY